MKELLIKCGGTQLYTQLSGSQKQKDQEFKASLGKVGETLFQKRRCKGLMK
jgi:hypothetical protein